jgi:hypothetical protein
MKRFKSIGLFMLYIIIGLSLTGNVLAASPSNGEFSTTQVQLNVADKRVEPFFEVRITAEEVVYLPISKLIKNLELYQFKINWEEERITGSISTDDKFSDVNYYFEFSTGRYQNEQGTAQLDDEKYFVEDEEIYLHHEALEEWLPVKANWDISYYEVKLIPKYKLLSEILAEREEAREKLLAPEAEVPEDDINEPSAEFFGPGIVHYRTGISYQFKNGDFYYPGLSLGYLGPLFYGDFQGEITVARQEEPPLQLENWQLVYHDLLANEKTRELIVEGQIGEGLGENQTEELIDNKRLLIGDNLIRYPNLLDRSDSVTGISLTNRGGYNYGTGVIAGQVPSGSEIELYYRDSLIDYQQVENNRYEFANVPVDGAYNIYEVVVYTPNGEIYSEEKRLASRPEKLAAGEYDYEIETGIIEGKLVGNGQLNYGWQENLSLGGGLISFLGLEDNQHNFLTGNFVFHPQLDTVLFTDSYLPISGEGFVYKTGVNKLFSDWIVEGTVSGYEEIVTPQREVKVVDNQRVHVDQIVGLDLKNRQQLYNLELGYQLANFDSVLYHNLGAEYRTKLPGDYLLRLEDTISGSSAESWENELSASLYYSGWKPANIKVNSGFTLKTQENITYQLGTEVISKQTANNKLRYAVGLTYNQAGLSPTVSSRYRINDRFDLELQARNDSVNLQLSFGEMREVVSPYNRIKGDNPHRGLVEGEVFLDENGDGIRQDDEQFFSGVEIVSEQDTLAATNEQGQFIISDLQTYKPIKLTVNPENLDALYVPDQTDIWVMPKPGRKINIQIPIVPVSGVSGSLQGWGDLSPAQQDRLTIVLVNQAGEQIKRVTPEYGGFYVIEKVKPGTYTLKVNFTEEINKSLEPESYEVEVPYGGMPIWHNNKNFKLK